MSIHNINNAPEGTKMWLLDVGTLEADVGFVIQGGGASTASNPNPPSDRRKLVMICVLIEHPTEGLLLYETGAGKDYPEVWGAPINDIFARVEYKPEQELDAAIAACGHSIKDVKGVIMGHLHLDHAGGLENFAGTDVPIYVHEAELKHAFYSIASKSDIGAYLPKDVARLDVNWQPLHGPHIELAQGIDILHTPGHTPGLCAMQLNLPNSGTWLLTSDQFHLKENYIQTQPQGWLARDHHDWMVSSRKIKGIQKRTNARVVFGHCRDTLYSYKVAPQFYD